MTTTTQPLKPKDFASDQEVRWCPGCGDYAILKAIQKTLANLEVAPERTAFVSGIGCSSRFPYYLSTYGFHTIHGRAPAIATGLKMANPDLDVWVITGDGDGGTSICRSCCSTTRFTDLPRDRCHPRRASAPSPRPHLAARSPTH